MKWFKRGCWFAAWAGWMWLAFGLYRELPRGMGEIVCRLPLEPGESSLGFVSQAKKMVTEIDGENGEGPKVRIWETAQGRLVREVSCGLANAKLRHDGFGHVVAFTRHNNEDEPQPRALVLGVDEEEWAELPPDANDHPEFHPTKPWALFFQRSGKDEIGSALVLDLKSGKALFRWLPKSKDAELGGQPFFVGEDSIAVQTSRNLGFKDGADILEFELEIWSLSSPNEKPRVFRDVFVGDDPFATQSGRVAWHHVGGDPPTVDVFDVASGRVIFADPPMNQRQSMGASGYWPGPRLSRDGRTVFRIMNPCLWDVDDGREIWRPRQGESIYNGEDQLELIETKEDWNIGGGVVTGQSYAVRSLRTGALLYRTLESTINGRGLIHPAGTFRFDSNENAIRRFPPTVNWAMLVVCQVILALPLVLLWAILRWRRKRSARMT